MAWRGCTLPARAGAALILLCIAATGCGGPAAPAATPSPVAGTTAPATLAVATATRAAAPATQPAAAAGATVGTAVGSPTAAQLAPEGSPAALASPAGAAPVRAANWEFTVERVVRTRTLVWRDRPGQVETAKENREEARGEWVVVYLAVKNVGTEPVNITRFDFELQDGTGQRYPAAESIAPAQYEFWVESQGLRNLAAKWRPGAGTRTALLYDLPAGTTGLKLVYTKTGTAIDLPEG